MNMQEIYDKLFSLCENGPLRSFTIMAYPDHGEDKLTFFFHFKNRKNCLYIKGRQLGKIFSLM